ncbi:MAG: hypothetical protein KatS3mg042_0638 [Rhodothermaceae bacterium]|nr:MAG: hypothetical protein KatS3mg042_0638 [Rhodothermaceae bacterium]
MLADLDALASDQATPAARSTPHTGRKVPAPGPAADPPRTAWLRERFGALWIGLTALAAVSLLFALTPLRGVLPGFGLPEQQSLAVLPFDNVGGDVANRAFIDGLVYTVTSKLTEMEAFQTALSVVPARDMLQAGLIGTRQAAERFNVNLVVAGSVERSATDLRLTLQLIDPRREKVLASRQLQAPLSDLSSLQAGVVHTLAELLALELDPDARATLTAGGTTVPLAFEFYTRALGYLQRFEEEANIDRAINLFELAVQEDPGYALAFAGLGEAYLHKYQAHQDRSWIDAAVRSGEQAVALNDRLAPVQVTLGMIYAETGFPQQAERAYQRALTLDPRSASAHYLLGDVYAHLGQDDRAEASYLRAIDLKPSYWLYHNALGQLYSRLGRHEEAIPPFKQVIALQPDNPWGYNNVGVQYNRMDRLDEAITWYERATRANPDARRATAFAYLNLAGIHYARDQFAEAARMYEQAVMNQPADRLAWIDLGDARFWAGDPEGAATAWREAERLARERLAVNAQDLEARALQAALLARLGETARARALLLDLPPGPDLSPDALLDLAKAWEILGDRPRALHYLQSALERGYAPAVLAFSAWLDDLRTDPAYARLLRQTLPGS